MCTAEPFLPGRILSTNARNKINQKEENLKEIREYRNTFFQGLIQLAIRFSASCYIHLISIIVHFLWLFLEPEPLQFDR